MMIFWMDSGPNRRVQLLRLQAASLSKSLSSHTPSTASSYSRQLLPLCLRACIFPLSLTLPTSSLSTAFCSSFINHVHIP